ncbi:MAG TPA: hypothetical protein VM734_31420, partial [Kofleriaceae bacterium]|nr:hypothetical protein [Kofleriaceae bacterium]
PPASAPGRVRSSRAPEATPEPSLTERWRRARLLRAQSQPQAALDECLVIADAGDPTWSPIALVEAVRVQLDALSAPEQAVALADRMTATWPDHPLAAEARTLRCRALRQLGRGDECAPDAGVP